MSPPNNTTTNNNNNNKISSVCGPVPGPKTILLALSILYRVLFWHFGICLATKVQVYEAVILTTLLYSSESWTPYQSQIRQLDVFHKSCLRIISGFTLQDGVINADLFALCQIDGIETFLMQSQLRWAGPTNA